MPYDSAAAATRLLGVNTERTVTAKCCPDPSSSKRFRCFEEEQELPIRRLTLLYGQNNTGKSALARLLPIIADSCEPRAAGPFASRSKALRHGSVRSLFWREGRDLELEFEWDAFSARYTFSFDAGIDEQRALIERCTITKKGCLIAEATLTASRDDRASHQWTVDGSPAMQGIFRGLVPIGVPAVPSAKCSQKA